MSAARAVAVAEGPLAEVWREHRIRPDYYTRIETDSAKHVFEAREKMRIEDGEVLPARWDLEYVCFPKPGPGVRDHVSWACSSLAEAQALAGAKIAAITNPNVVALIPAPTRYWTRG